MTCDVSPVAMFDCVLGARRIIAALKWLEMMLVPSEGFAFSSKAFFLKLLAFFYPDSQDSKLPLGECCCVFGFWDP